MRRLLLFVGMAAAVAAAGPAEAGAQDPGKAEIVVTKVSGTVYLLEGAGGNVAASVGEDGVLLVDDGYAAMGPKIRAALKGITSKPVRYIVNTHWHADHVGGNAQFPEAVVVAQNNVRLRMETGGKVRGVEVRPAAAEALPKLTFLSDITLHMNGEDIRAIQFPGHTDGDCIVVFPRSNVVHMGDNFAGSGFPLVDVESGGSAHVLGEVVDLLLKQMGPNARFIPGHGPVARPFEMQAYLSMLQGTRTAVEEGVKQGKSLAQLTQAHVLAKWASWSNPLVSTNDFLSMLYADVTEEEPVLDEDSCSDGVVWKTTGDETPVIRMEAGPVLPLVKPDAAPVPPIIRKGPGPVPPISRQEVPSAPPIVRNGAGAVAPAPPITHLGAAHSIQCGKSPTTVSQKRLHAPRTGADR
jgi:cyclase